MTESEAVDKVRTRDLARRIGRCMLAEQHALRRRLRGLERAQAAGRLRPSAVRQFEEAVTKSETLRAERQAHLPRPTYPEQLPVVEKKEEIAKAISENQVVVICGETGSGKTTQLPKICLELGRGVAGMIGHTQPRRIAARSIASRLSEELKTSVGRAVGYKVRFGDKTSADTFIKVMTDGILLAETQGDRYLEQYDTIIIDEAHERSLNIDFLLGYLKQLLPKRPDLKVIITSATIDPQRFSDHFDGAPIVEVSGRTYPVEVRYRPLATEDPEEADRDLQQAVLDAVDELAGEARGDVLVFMSGEREIRETAEALRKHHPAETEILPLFARLSTKEQNRVFHPHQRQRIVLATNVAETSLTVPGIRYVVDPGQARISRYSARSKVQRLPVESISQASADQRKGRCGRVGPGVCIRLYSEEDFLSREEFTPPEIVRTNLASVILQMKSLNLGKVDDFPFIDPPNPRMVRDGYHTLRELGAVDEQDQITPLGKELAKLPIDPRIGRMILAADKEGALDEVLVIAAALSVQDPRERPLEAQEAADQAHAQFEDEESDFLGYLKLWSFYHEQSKKLSNNKLRKCCQQNFLSYIRMREWHDIHRQLKTLVTGMGYRPNSKAAGYDAIHRSLLAGLLGNVGMKGEVHEYVGANGKKFHIFPGSSLFKKKPKWLMAAELVETSRLYARTVAKIQPDWIEPLAEHVVSRSYSEPHWQSSSAHVAAYEKVSLYGLEIIPRRLTHYGPIDPKVSREIFIHFALVEGDFQNDASFFRHNQRLVEEIEELEHKSRKRDVLVDQQLRYAFYDKRVPADVYNGPLFEKWRRQAERKDKRLLFMRREDLMLHDAAEVTEVAYPDRITPSGSKLPLGYQLEPGQATDGVTVTVPLAGINQLTPDRLEWLVPGMLKDKIVALIKTLPKDLRRNFVPAPDYAEACLKQMKQGEGTLLEAVGATLGSLTGIVIPRDAWQPEQVPDYLRMNIRVVDERGKQLAMSRDLAELQRKLGQKAKESFAKLPKSKFNRDGLIRWDFGDLPERVEVRRDGLVLPGYPAVVDQSKAVGLRVMDSPETARAANRAGVRRLFMLALKDEMKYFARSLPNLQKMCMHYAPLGSGEELKWQLLGAAVDQVFFADGPDIRTQMEFELRLESGYHQVEPAVRQVCDLAERILKAYHVVQLQLGERIPPLWQASVRDVQGQLAELMPKYFLTAHPQPWVMHLPRYLAGIEKRLHKLANGGLAKDQSLMRAFEPWIGRLLERREKHRAQRVHDPQLVLYRWMLEEMRVSLFAQELGTAMPVSEKRLEQQWAQVRA